MDDIIKVNIRGTEYIYDKIGDKLLPVKKICYYFENNNEQLNIVMQNEVVLTCNITLEAFINEVLNTQAVNWTS